MKRGFGFFIVVINRPVFVVFACHRVHIQEILEHGVFSRFGG